MVPHKCCFLAALIDWLYDDRKLKPGKPREDNIWANVRSMIESSDATFEKKHPFDTDEHAVEFFEWLMQEAFWEDDEEFNNDRRRDAKLLAHNAYKMAEEYRGKVRL